uniref:CCHC-type domain-containing protein n=1 Tax=Tanacetum cinerariifolium TaxID=118510 RepID=A0A699H426_TANCI|nr:hypothetical protein [Tanacetum cinerariifolium]
MLNKDNSVPWSSRIIRYARSRPNGKMIVDSIENGPYIRRMITTLGEPNLPVLVPESFHEQTDEELTENDIKRMDADDQAIQTILLGLHKDVYAAEKKAKLFNEWEKFTSTDGESIESYYHCFMQLMNDLKRNKHFPENIASNLKFLNNLQPELKRHVTIVRQTKNLHETDFTQIYDFLKMNQDEVNELRAERLVKSRDPFALMAHSQNSFNFPTAYKDQSSFRTHSQQSFPINNKTSSNPRIRQIAQPVMNMIQDKQTQNVGGNGGISLDIQNAGVQSGGNQNGLVVVPGIANQSESGNVVAARAEGTRMGNQARCYNCRGLGHIARNCTARPRRKDAAYLQTQLLIAQNKEAGIQLQAKEFDFMAAASYLDEIEEVNTNCILMANLQHASTSGPQHDKAPVYDTDGSAEVQLNDNRYDNDIFNTFTQEEQYTDLLEPIPKPQLVPQNDNHITYVAPSMVQSGGTVETSFAPNEEIRAHQETVYRNLVDQVAHVNMVNCNMRATNAELKFELARYKIQEQRIKISQEKYDKLEKCYQKSVYQEQCLTRKINALHPSSAKQIMTLNDEISNLNKQLSKEKSSISSLMEEKKRLKHDFKTREDKFLDKEKMALGYPNPSYLKKAQLKQQSLYNGNLLIEDHDPPTVYDSEETLELAQESREKMRFLKKEIKPANYAKINHLSGGFVPQTNKSNEELFLSNVSNMVIVSKTISIPNEDLSDDTTPSVARKFLNEVKSSLVTLQRMVKQKMTLEVHNWSSSAHKEVERLQAQLRDLKGKSSDTPSTSNTLDLLNQKLESKIVELEFQVVDYEREISHLKTTYKNTFDSIKSNWAHAKLHDLIYENAQLRARVFENTSESMKNTLGTSVTPRIDKPKLSVVTPLSKKLHASMPSHSVPQPIEFNVVKHNNVIAP